MLGKMEKTPKFPFEDCPRLERPDSIDYAPPSVPECHKLWDKYQMLPNVKAHSRVVAQIAFSLARRSHELDMPVNPQAALASGLLHDIAKSWCIKNGGSHALIGASWTRQETGDFAVAQGVLLHVHWPWQLPQGRQICILPIFVLYGDKRAMHDKCVTLEERFEDLLERYGKTEQARAGIKRSFEQALAIEKALSQQLEWDLHEDTFDCGRLVD